MVETKSLLSVLKQICENHYDDFDEELTNNVVQFAKNEMIKSSDSQFPASDILITLGRGRSDQVNYIFYSLKLLLYFNYTMYKQLLYSGQQYKCNDLYINFNFLLLFLYYFSDKYLSSLWWNFNYTLGAK